MKNTDWPPAEVEDVARRSGKPLEVAAALAFLGGGWTVELGSYFADGALDELRELDVLVTKQKESPEHGIPVRVRVLLSCKGFRPDTSPLTYSVSRENVPPAGRSLITYHRDRAGEGTLPECEANGAKILLKSAGLASARPLVAFDLVRRKEEGKPDKLKVAFEGLGDRQLYEGLDSALKAAFFWAHHERNGGGQVIGLYVPVLVLAVPFWDVCIDGGRVATPEIRRRGYHAARYPRGSSMTSVMTLVWCADELSDLVTALNELFDWFYEARVTREVAVVLPTVGQEVTYRHAGANCRAQVTRVLDLHTVDVAVYNDSGNIIQGVVAVARATTPTDRQIDGRWWT